MNESSLPRAARPCGECPWRRDQPPGKFSPERWEALRVTARGPAGESVPLDAPLFACHMSKDGGEHDRACAGWLAVEGHAHVTVRLAIAQGRLPADAIEPGPGWPELYSSYDELADANDAAGEA